jgi:hypothetical protein
VNAAPRIASIYGGTLLAERDAIMHRSILAVAASLALGCSPAQQRAVGGGVVIAGIVTGTAGTVMLDPCGEIAGEPRRSCVDDRRHRDRMEGAMVLSAGVALMLTGAVIYATSHSGRSAPLAPSP